MTVTCNGCFDGLHPGHLFFLGFCRGQGDRLVVGINSDEYIVRNKRPNPTPEADRQAALMDLGFISEVRIFCEDDPSELVRAVRPAIHCVGAEYEGRVAEQAACDEVGAKVVFVPRIGSWSSSGCSSAG